MGSVCCSDGRDRACGPADDGDDHLDDSSEYYEYVVRPPWPCKPFRPSTPPLGRSASDLSVNTAYDLPPPTAGARPTAGATAAIAAPVTALRGAISPREDAVEDTVQL